nr:phosphatase PAP2 family protein [Rhizobium sp. FY34]
MPLGVAIFDVGIIILRFPHRRRLAYRHLYSIRRLAALIGGLILLWAMMVFQGSFTSIKNIFPDLHGGFIHDHLHADIDRWLHLGVDPWRYLYQVAAWPPLLHLIEFNYNGLWFVVCFGGLFLVATSSRADAICQRYVIMFMLNVHAELGRAGKPAGWFVAVCRTGLLWPRDRRYARFADQLAFLASSSSAHSASAYQAYLWKIRERGFAGFGGGISAFPSVHVGLATMNALFFMSIHAV